MKLAGLTILMIALGAMARAEAPRVSTDIAPVHSLVARVMQGVGQPDLLVDAGTSPHDFSLKPSTASALAEADVIFWIGPELTPWLERAVDSLGSGSRSVTFLSAPGIEMLGRREGAAFEAEGHDDDHDHDHEGPDPHIWLDPVNARQMLNMIAEALAEADPENAARYTENAVAGNAELQALESEIAAKLAPLRGRGFLVFHDAYHYFEDRFEFEAAGAIAPGDGAQPGPKRLAKLREMVREGGAICVFSEPQLDPKAVKVVAEGAGLKTGVLDPLGVDLTPGPDLYPRMLRGLAGALHECLK